MVKMDKKWVILCSTAVAAAYTSGFYSTETQAVKMESAQHNQISLHTKVQQSGTTGNIANYALNQQNKKAKQKYKDGTFTGSGMNRRGDIQVAVTLRKDKIVDVQISNWGMHYSESDVVDLPGQVIQRQSANVGIVSGATYSTEAFTDAVQDAINQAQNS
ncbi:FMN-binding protein [Neobacillus terrae]|uniref:FMN-binding protein n=1 Tax=Neobacillus terrae TaxID=3034837 RepID=UPI00140DA185|nr:FMN-binding protein [Neobacillus terrae]NHM32033.1 FMN-binding protein [Neobacillus terrae]